MNKSGLMKLVFVQLMLTQKKLEDALELVMRMAKSSSFRLFKEPVFHEKNRGIP